MQLSSVFGVIWLVAGACPPCPVNNTEHPALLPLVGVFFLAYQAVQLFREAGFVVRTTTKKVSRERSCNPAGVEIS